MPPAPIPARTQPNWRLWTSLSIKAGLAIAVLTVLAQWATRSGSDKAAPATVAARAVEDPVSTGSLGSRAPAPAAKPAELDQHGLTSLVSQVQGGAPAPKPVPAKKR